MTKNVKSEIQNTGFADILCDETIHRDDNHIFHLCKWNIKDQFIGYSDVIFTHKDTHRLLHPDYTNSLNPYNVTLSSATLSRITNISPSYIFIIYLLVSLDNSFFISSVRVSLIYFVFTGTEFLCLTRLFTLSISEIKLILL